MILKSVIIGECEDWSKEIFVRMWCARTAHTVRTSCATGAHRNGLLQRLCRPTAKALQWHCRGIAVNIYLARLYIAVILLHLRKHQN